MPQCNVEPSSDTPGLESLKHMGPKPRPGTYWVRGHERGRFRRWGMSHPFPECPGRGLAHQSFFFPIWHGGLEVDARLAGCKVEDLVPWTKASRG